jgi:AcrR family transcriptional regulator
LTDRAALLICFDGVINTLHSGSYPLMARKSDGDSSVAGRLPMRESIKQVATELLIRHGFHGTSFRHIAERLDITTTNIHYHFGNKEKLVEEVVRDYVTSTCAKHKEIWENPGRSLIEKLRDVAAFNRTRYKAFNRGRKSGQPWSLIGRLRLEGEVLSPGTRESLTSFTDHVHAAIRVAVRIAHDNGELVADAPLDDLAFLLVNIVNSSSVFTQDAGNFERLEQFFEAFSRVMLSAYAPKRAAPAAAE